MLTGAGISTESGVSDFRSPGGVWSRYKTVTLQEFTSSLEKRKYYWQYKAETIPGMLEAKPNAAHKALTQLDACMVQTVKPYVFHALKLSSSKMFCYVLSKGKMIPAANPAAVS